MSSIAIIGAGPLGGELAFLLARRDVARQIRLVDDEGQIAAGKALDIQQAAPIVGFAAGVKGSTDIFTAAGTDLIVIADRPGGTEWQGEEGLALMRQVVQLGGHRSSLVGARPDNADRHGSVVLCSGASHADLVERSVRELGIARTRILGSAPEALAAGARALVALEAGCSPSDVALTVVGLPPRQSVIVWDDATIAGYAALSALDDDARRRVTALVDRLWPPGPLTLAAAAMKAAQAILGQTRSLLAAFVAPDDSYGRRARTVALPVRLGPSGIAQVEHPHLSVRDRVALDASMLL